MLSLSVKALQQTNLGALHGLQQVGERLFETADEHPTELLEQSAETRHGCPETHTQKVYKSNLVFPIFPVCPERSLRLTGGSGGLTGSRLCCG